MKLAYCTSHTRHPWFLPTIRTLWAFTEACQDMLALVTDSLLPNPNMA